MDGRTMRKTSTEKLIVYVSYWFGVVGIALLSAVIGFRFGVIFAWGGIPLVLVWPHILVWLLNRLGISDL